MNKNPFLILKIKRYILLLMKNVSEVPMLETMMLLQGLLYSSIDKKKFPYSKGQLNICIALYLEGELTMKRVARYLACSQEQATRAVAPLADAGYVERRTDPANRTHVFIRLTEEGKRYLLEQCDGMRIAVENKLENALSEKEQKTLHTAAGTLLVLLKKVLENSV